MALLADKSADVNSNLVQGTNAQTLAFTMPGGVAMKVLSVVATVNNGAATAVTPELTIRDQSGVVIAARKQSSTIPAGDTGTATWALRLDDDAASTTPGGSGIQFVTDPQSGGWLYVETTSFNPATGNSVDFVVNNSDYVTDVQSSSAYIVYIDSGTSELALRTNRFLAFISTGETVNVQPGFAEVTVSSSAFVTISGTTGVTNRFPTGGGANMSSPAGKVVESSDAAGTRKLGFFGATNRAQFAAITAPAGGATVDAEARTAINSILTMLGAAAGGYGLTA